MSAAGVVGVQDLIDQQKEVENASFAKGGLNGQRSFTSAQYVVMDVRMSHRFIFDRGYRFQGTDFKALGPIHLFPVQVNLEGAKQNPFQLDGICDDA